MFQDNADPVLLGEHDVALASIEKVVAGKDGVSDGVFDKFLLYNSTVNRLPVCTLLPQQLSSPRLSDLHRCTSVQFNILES